MNTANNNSDNSYYTEGNDRVNFMTDEEKIVNKLEAEGFTDQFRVENKKLKSLTDPKKSYKAKEIKAVNFYRYEGITDPDDMSIIYAIETSDGRKGTLIDAYGRYADEETGAFMQDVEIHKKVSSKWKA
ncbi:MAG TPA: hypothetical protein VD794_06540 [Flavisolibacter sp.]|nr:hypothetical protein [Flavisolibacter sp.]